MTFKRIFDLNSRKLPPCRKPKQRKNCENFFVDLDLVVRSGISKINLPYNIMIRFLWNLSRTRYFEA